MGNQEGNLSQCKVMTHTQIVWPSYSSITFHRREHCRLDNILQSVGSTGLDVLVPWEQGKHAIKQQTARIKIIILIVIIHTSFIRSVQSTCATSSCQA